MPITNGSGWNRSFNEKTWLERLNIKPECAFAANQLAENQSIAIGKSANSVTTT
jgi:hypothetical protein